MRHGVRDDDREYGAACGQQTQQFSPFSLSTHQALLTMSAIAVETIPFFSSNRDWDYFCVIFPSFLV
jgi:hypothetical protein